MYVWNARCALCYTLNNRLSPHIFFRPLFFLLYCFKKIFVHVPFCGELDTYRLFLRNGILSDID